MSNEEILNLEITPNQYFILECIITDKKHLIQKLIEIDAEDKIKNDIWKLYIKDFIEEEGFDHILETTDVNLLKLSKKGKEINFGIYIIGIDPFYNKEQNIKMNLKQPLLDLKEPKPIKYWFEDSTVYNLFFEEWFNLFPKGVRNNSGKLLRSDQEHTKEKLLEYLKKYKDSDRDIILNCTKKFINNQKRENYAFCRQAQYFIDKKGVGSDLRNEYESYNTSTDVDIFSTDI